MSKKGRITITLDRALIDGINAEVAAGRADSFSAWIGHAVLEHLESERRLAAMAKAIAAYEAEFGVITPEEIAEQERKDRRNAIVIRGGRVFRPRKRQSRAR